MCLFLGCCIYPGAEKITRSLWNLSIAPCMPPLYKSVVKFSTEKWRKCSKPSKCCKSWCFWSFIVVVVVVVWSEHRRLSDCRGIRNSQLWYHEPAQKIVLFSFQLGFYLLFHQALLLLIVALCSFVVFCGHIYPIILIFPQLSQTSLKNEMSLILLHGLIDVHVWSDPRCHFYCCHEALISLFEKLQRRWIFLSFPLKV